MANTINPDNPLGRKAKAVADRINAGMDLTERMGSSGRNWGKTVDITPIPLKPVKRNVGLSGYEPVNPLAPEPMPGGLKAGQVGPELPRDMQMDLRAEEIRRSKTGPNVGPGPNMDTGAATRSQGLEMSTRSPYVETPAEVLTDPVTGREYPNEGLAGNTERMNPTTEKFVFDPVSKRAIPEAEYNARQLEMVKAEARMQMKNAGATSRNAAGDLFDKAGKLVGRLTQSILSGEAAYGAGRTAGANVEGAQEGFKEGPEIRENVNQAKAQAQAEADAKLDAEANGNKKGATEPPVSETVQKETAERNKKKKKSGKGKKEKNILNKGLNKLGDLVGGGINKFQAGYNQVTSGAGKFVTKSTELGLKAAKASGPSIKGGIKGGIKGAGALASFDILSNVVQTFSQEGFERGVQTMATDTGIAVGHIINRIENGEFIELAEEMAIAMANAPGRIVAGFGDASANVAGQLLQGTMDAGESLGLKSQPGNIFARSDVTGKHADFSASLEEIGAEDYNSPFPDSAGARMNRFSNALEFGSVEDIGRVGSTIDEWTGRERTPSLSDAKIPTDVDPDAQAFEEEMLAKGQVAADARTAYQKRNKGTNNSFTNTTSPLEDNLSAAPNEHQHFDDLDNEQRDINETRGLRAANNEISGRPSNTYDGLTGERMPRLDARGLRTDQGYIEPNEWGGRNRFHKDAGPNFMGELSRAYRQSAGRRSEQIDERTAALGASSLSSALSSTREGQRKEASEIYGMIGSENSNERSVGWQRAASQLKAQINNENYDPNNPVTIAAQEMISKEILEKANIGLLRAGWNTLAPSMFGGGGRGLFDFLNGNPVMDSQDIAWSLAIDSDNDVIIRSDKQGSRGIDIGNNLPAPLLAFLRLNLPNRIE